MDIDLHLHTTFSDGDFSPRDVVRMAKKKGLGMIAITDHDECRGFGDIGKTDGITVLPGIELAARFEGEAHVLGLCIDWRRAAMLSHVGRVTELRCERAQRIVEKLREAGIGITIDDVRERCGADVIGRPHIAAALVKNGCAGSVREAFRKYLSKHSEFYVPFDKISVSEAARLVNDAGGKAVLAHPGLINEGVRRRLFPQLCDMGFWGVEAYHPSHTDGQCTEFVSMARSLGLSVTAGSDFHGSAKPDIKIGCERRGGEYLKESVRILMQLR